MSDLPSFELLSQYEKLQGDVHAAIERVLRSGRLILGPEVEAFEREFAAWVAAGGDGQAAGVANGTDALVLCLRALDIGPGDEVVTVPNTAVPTVAAIRQTGASVVFCDVDERTALLDLQQLGEAVTERTRAVVPVHLYGNAVDVRRLREGLDALGRSEIRIVEDCAQAHGTKLGGRPVGTFGDNAAFSFYPTKNLGAYGDGGACFSTDSSCVERIRALRFYGTDDRGEAQEEGQNSRLDELQAAILRVKLAHLDEWLGARRALAARYRERLPAGALPFDPTPDADPAWHLMVVRVLPGVAGARDRVRAALSERGIGSGIHYPTPIHHMPAYRSLAAPGSLPVAEQLAGEILSLPFYPELSESDVDRVCAALGEILGA